MKDKIGQEIYKGDIVAITKIDQSSLIEGYVIKVTDKKVTCINIQHDNWKWEDGKISSEGVIRYTEEMKNMCLQDPKKAKNYARLYKLHPPQ